MVWLDADPRVGFELLLQLPGRPLRAAKRDQVVGRAVTVGDVTQDFHGGGQADLVGDLDRGLVLVVGRVQDEAALLLHRAAAGDAAAGRHVGVDRQVFQHFGEGQTVVAVIDDHAHGTVFAVQAHVDHRLFEQRVADVRGCHQQLALQPIGGAGHGKLSVGRDVIGHRIQTRRLTASVKAQNCDIPLHGRSTLR